MGKRFILFLIISLFISTIISAQIRFTLIPDSPRPGDPVTIAVNMPIREAVLLVNNRQVARAAGFFVDGINGQPGFAAAILAVPSTVEAENAIIRINNESGVLVEIPIRITPREFRSGTINLDQNLTSLVADPNPQRTIESERLWEILNTTGNQVYHTGRFILPVTSTRRTSQFGTRRINVYSDGRRVTSIHAGIDFGIPTGTEVFAVGRGRVVLSRMRILTGYSVILEHGPGIYTLYYHLDSVLAIEGAIVETGAVIGLSGSTGFSTGPHLHWELRVSSENTDPDAFVNRALIDRDLIISRIFN